ncbi:hypothetical protein D3C85_195460 [compost metagenome]
MRRGETPVLMDPVALAQMRGDLPQHGELGAGQHQIVPACGGRQALGQAVKAAPAGLGATLPEQCGGIGRGVLQRGLERGGSELQGARVQPELACRLLQPRAGPGRGMRPQRVAPEGPAIGLLRAGNRAMPCSRAQRDRFADRQEAQRARLFGQMARRGRQGVAGVDVQRRAQQNGFALPQGAQRLAFGRGVRDVLGLQHQAGQPGLPRRARGHIFLRAGVVALQDEHRQGRVAVGGDPFGDPSRRRFVRGRGMGQGRRGPQQGTKARVQFVQSGQEVQHPFVDAQARRAQVGRFVHLQQPPAAQRVLRRQRAPVRAFQRAQCQGKAGVAHSAATALRGGAQLGQAGIHFDAGAQQQQVAFERRQAERRAQLIDRPFAVERGAGLRQPLRTLARRAAARLVQARAQPREFRGQQLLVGVGPAQGRARVHGSSIWRFRYRTGTASRSTSGLSMPSTRRRARNCVPAGGASRHTKANWLAGAV